MISLFLATLLFVVGGHVLAEVVGYFWHRFAEHSGYLGDSVRYHHWVHHEVDYPVTNLRPVQSTAKARCGSWAWFVAAFLTSKHWLKEMLGQGRERLCFLAKYKSAGSWTWYVLALAVALLILLLLPLRDALLVIFGGMLYGWYVDNYFHSAFHIRDHWLQRFRWFRRLTRLHDIHHITNANYGISFFWMDRLFGTFRTVAPQKENIFPGYEGLTTR